MTKLTLSILVLLWFPVAALALGEAPLSVPATPNAPPSLAPGDAPPVLELDLPEPSRLPQLPVDGMPEVLMAAPELPPQAFGGGVPDLSDTVELPDGASSVVDLAPPFGAPFPATGGRSSVVPEPSTALLLAGGILGLGLRRTRAGKGSRAQAHGSSR